MNDYDAISNAIFDYFEATGQKTEPDLNALLLSMSPI